jgi:hypothetical protein
MTTITIPFPVGGAPLRITLAELGAISSATAGEACPSRVIAACVVGTQAPAQIVRVAFGARRVASLPVSPEPQPLPVSWTWESPTQELVITGAADPSLFVLIME